MIDPGYSEYKELEQHAVVRPETAQEALEHVLGREMIVGTLSAAEALELLNEACF